MFGNSGKWVADVLKRVLTINFLFSQIIVPLGVLSFYIILSSRVFPVGITKAFFMRFEKYLIPFTILLLVVFLSILGIRRIKPNFFSASRDKLSAYDLLLLLLPMTPVT